MYTWGRQVLKWCQFNSVSFRCYSVMAVGTKDRLKDFSVESVCGWMSFSSLCSVRWMVQDGTVLVDPHPVQPPMLPPWWARSVCCPHRHQCHLSSTQPQTTDHSPPWTDLQWCVAHVEGTKPSEEKGQRPFSCCNNDHEDQAHDNDKKRPTGTTCQTQREQQGLTEFTESGVKGS